MQLHICQDCQHLFGGKNITKKLQVRCKLQCKMCIKLIIITIMMLSTTIALCSLFHTCTFHTQTQSIIYLTLPHVLTVSMRKLHPKKHPPYTTYIHYIFNIILLSYSRLEKFSNALGTVAECNYRHKLLLFAVVQNVYICVYRWQNMRLN